MNYNYIDEFIKNKEHLVAYMTYRKPKYVSNMSRLKKIIYDRVREEVNDVTLISKGYYDIISDTKTSRNERISSSYSRTRSISSAKSTSSIMSRASIEYNKTQSNINKYKKDDLFLTSIRDLTPVKTDTNEEKKQEEKIVHKVNIVFPIEYCMKNRIINTKIYKDLRKNNLSSIYM